MPAPTVSAIWFVQTNELAALYLTPRHQLDRQTSIEVWQSGRSLGVRATAAGGMSVPSQLVPDRGDPGIDSALRCPRARCVEGS